MLPQLNVTFKHLCLYLRFRKKNENDGNTYLSDFILILFLKIEKKNCIDYPPSFPSNFMSQ